MLKKFLSLLLLLSVVMTAVACQSLEIATTEPTTTPATGEETVSETGAKPVTVFPKTVTTWDDINGLPIASESMSLQERRQLCADFFRMQQTVQWTPDEDVYYLITNTGVEQPFPMGHVYAGLPYISEAKCGNLYTFMEYYNSETGVLELGTIGGKNIAFLIGTHCSGGSMWAWARVVNSTTARTTHTFTYHNGAIPIGPYTYDLSIETWTRDYGTRKVCQENGKQTMYESYAKFQLADGMVTYNGSGHVQMVSAVPHVERDANGEINGKKSFVLFIDQDSGLTVTKAADGSVVKIVGAVDEKYTFEKLYSAGYLPFTFKELIGEDPVEKAVASLSAGTGDLTVDEYENAVIESNYPISNSLLILTVNGEEARRFSTNSTFNKNTMECSRSVVRGQLEGLLKKGEIYYSLSVRVGTGELLPISEGKILPNPA